MGAATDIRGAFREKVVSGVGEARSGRGWVDFLINELAAARKLNYKWAWIHAKLAELGIEISIKGLRDTYAALKGGADEAEVARLVALVEGPAILGAPPASTSSRPAAGSAAQKRPAANAAGRPSAGAQSTEIPARPSSGGQSEKNFLFGLDDDGKVMAKSDVIGADKQ
jgi:hypothetical protein